MTLRRLSLSLKRYIPPANSSIFGDFPTMCGVVCAVETRPVESFVYAAHRRQRHRGPDSEGFFFEQIGATYIGLAHQRLAILDLSARGAQPMRSHSGNSVIIFNGEIYNYRSLASQYGLQDLRTGTDTEVALELIEKIGIFEASRAFNGMWSIIVFNRGQNRLYFSRDRLGKKPLYYASTKKGMVFASEMHSLLRHPDIEKTADSVTAGRFLAQALQNTDDHSWISGISAFPPAATGHIDVDDPTSGLRNIQKFWSYVDFINNRETRNTSDFLEETYSTVQDAIDIRLHADVPVGIALSGGLDSSIIAAVSKRMHHDSGNAVRLFSATNPGKKEDESEYVFKVARHLGLDVTQFTLDAGGENGLYELLKECIRHNDGPLSSFSNVLFYKLMEAARQSDVTVVLTGQGADEAFCGYRKYPVLELKRRLKNRAFFAAFSLGLGIVKRGTVLSDFSFSEAKRYLGRSNADLLGPQAKTSFRAARLAEITTLADRQWLDIEQYSVPYLCHYEDRMSMAWSREVRAPFLDFRVIELGLKMPATLKLHNGWTKYPLRQAFASQLPASVTWRKDKKGFINPQDDWLRSTLKDQVLSLMSNPSAEVYTQGLVNRSEYLKRFHSYCQGSKTVWFRDVFSPFSLELWLQELRHTP